jgi:hypothetical protein
MRTVRAERNTSLAPDQLFGLARQFLGLLREFVEIYRRPFHSAIAWFAVAGGILLSSGSPWMEPMIRSAGAVLDSEFPTHLEAFRDWARTYKPDSNQLSSVIGGVTLVVAGLVYHFSMSWHRTRSREADRIDLRKDRGHDRDVVKKFYEHFPQSGFDRAIVNIKADPNSITTLNESAAFWREPAHFFRMKALEFHRHRIQEAHAAGSDAVRQNAPNCSLNESIVELRNSYLTLGEDINQAYADRAAEIEKRWR